MNASFASTRGAMNCSGSTMPLNNSIASVSQPRRGSAPLRWPVGGRGPSDTVAPISRSPAASRHAKIRSRILRASATVSC
jgi:hypothetical protein